MRQRERARRRNEEKDGEQGNKEKVAYTMVHYSTNAVNTHTHTHTQMCKYRLSTYKATRKVLKTHSKTRQALQYYNINPYIINLRAVLSFSCFLTGNF